MPVQEETNNKTPLHPSWYPLCFYCLVSLLMVGPNLFPPTSISSFGNAPDDGSFFLWDFWWTKKALLQQTNPYWTDLLFHPAGTTLTFHNYPLFYSVLSIPFQVLLPGIGGIVLALNAIIYISFALAGFAAYRLTLHVTGSYPASLIAGLIYAFMPFHMTNMVSLHLLSIEFLPFYILSLLRLHENPSWKRALALAVCLGIVYYTSLEYALFLLLFSSLWLIFILVKGRGSLSSRFVGCLIFSMVSFAAIASPQLLQQTRLYASQANALGMGLEQATFWSPALLSFFTPTHYHPLYGSALSFAGELSGTSGVWGMRSETVLGYIPLGLTFVSMVRVKRDQSFFWVFAALCFFILSLGPHLRVTGRWLSSLPLPYLYLHEMIPFLRSSRDPTRFLSLSMLMLSILAAYGWRACLSRFRSSRLATLATILLGLLLLFEYLPGTGPKYRPEPHPAYQRLSNSSEDFAVMDLCYEPFSLVQQIFHGKKITSLPYGIPRSPSNALTLPVEEDFRDPVECLNLDSKRLDLRLAQDKSDLRKYHIRYAVLPPEPLLPLQLRLAALLGARVQRIQDLYLLRFTD